MIKALTIFDNSVAPESNVDGLLFVWGGGTAYIAASGNNELVFRLAPVSLAQYMPDLFGPFYVPFPDRVDGTVLFAVDLPAATYKLNVLNASVSQTFSVSAYIIPKV